MKIATNILLFIGVLLILIIVGQYFNQHPETNDLELLKAEFAQKHVPSVDHSKLEVLQQNFKDPHEVTEACITCHTERHKELLESSHYTWEREAYIEGRGVTYAGKKNLINNFCIGIGGSEMSCTRCHAGYGWEDAGFDFENHKNIDCLVCHDNSGTYVKASGKAGYQTEDTDLTKVAQSVGLPQRWNCGNCHFYSGGGNNVKHGDLEEAMFEAGRDVDVHMAVDGSNMQCVDCHTAENHKMKGQLYSVSSMDRERMKCEECHGGAPHAKSILNEHTIKVACQTCHIPIYAKVNATKTSWDWSKAGKLKDGEPYHEEDEDGNHTYLSIKGEFTWGKNLKPEYVWFNGTADHYFLGDKVDTTQSIKMNTLHGDYKDRNAKIIPVKIHKARQIYDCKNKTIIQPKLYAEKPGQGGYWKDFDWHLAAEMGMATVDKPYSGHYCFVNTEMYWPLNHMVSDADESVSCTECHTREGGRLDNLQDFYMPGRNYSASLDFAGKWLIILSLLGTIAHGAIRIFSARRRNGGNK